MRPRDASRTRGVRLGDLDRAKVYRSAHTGRRWEVLGAVRAPEADAAPDVAGSAGGEAPRTPAAPERAADPDAPRTAGP